MLSITLTGNLGRDGEVKSIGQQQVIKTSVAVKQGKDTTWVTLNIPMRGDYYKPENYRKGMKVIARGNLKVGVYNEKPMVDCWVDFIEVVGGQPQPAVRQEPTPYGYDDNGNNEPSLPY